MLLTVYGAKWCPDVRFAVEALNRCSIPYTFVSVEELDKEEIGALVKAHNGEDWAVPTFFADGKYYACPSMNEEIFQNVLAFYRLN